MSLEDEDRKLFTNQRQVYTDTIRLRVYFEGVLFPYAKSVTVTETEGNVSCQIEVPPSVKLLPDQWAGMTCHVFYANKRVLDTFGSGQDDNKEPVGSGWPILFQGELAGESVTTTVQSENVVLNFVSHARHFEQTLLYFYDLSRQNNILDVKRQATFIGNTRINVEAEGVLSKGTQILTTLNRRIAETEADQGRNIAFTATALELLRAAGENHAVYNVFDRKFKLSQRFAAYVDPDVKNILKLNTLKNMIEQRAQALPSFASIMQLLEIPTTLMKYNWNQLAQPRLRPGRLPTHLRRTEQASDLFTRISKAVRKFGKDALTKGPRIRTDVGLIILPNDYVDVVRRAGKTSQVSGIIGVIPYRTFVNNIFVTYEDLLKNDPNGDAAKLLLLAFQKQVDIYSLPDFGQLEEKGKKEKVSSDLTDLYGEAKQKVIDGSDEQEQDTQAILDIDQAALVERDELNEFTVTPNLHFAQPPKCNVFFPASFGVYGITRNHFQEPTRLYGRFDLVPAARDAKNTAIEWYIAPLAQAYHFLDKDNLARFSPAYEKHLNGLPHSIPSTPPSPTVEQGQSTEPAAAPPQEGPPVGTPKSSAVAVGNRVNFQNLSVTNFADSDEVESFNPSPASRPIPTEIVVHESVTRDVDSTVRILRRKGFGVHFMIDADGAVTQHNDYIKDRLVHGGPHNKSSVAIEMINPYYPKNLRRTGPGSRWSDIIENAPWAHRNQYVIPNLAQLEALTNLISFLTSPKSGTEIPREWIGLSDDGTKMYMVDRPGAKDPKPGIYAHGYYAHDDGTFCILYAYLRLERALSPADARATAISLATGAKNTVVLP